MVAEVVGQAVVDIRGEKIGRIERLRCHGDEQWAVVKLGLFGLRSTLVPLNDAVEEDGKLRVVYEREHVKDAPDVDTDGDELGDEDADLLHGYYGLERVTGLTAPGAEDEMELPRETRDAEPPGMKEGPQSPLTKRRRKRAEELGVPSANGGDAESTDEVEVSEAPTPTTSLPDDDSDEGSG
jgi:hypothetical protein